MWVPLLISISTVIAQTCPKFSCADNLEPGVCMYKASDTSYILEGCSSVDEYCPFTTTMDSVCTAKEPAVNYPGDSCVQNLDCSSRRCIGKICAGAGLNELCTSLYACSPSLYCDPTTFRCVFQKANGSACLSAYECKNGSDCVAGICTAYLSVAVGQPTDNVNSYGFSMACESMFAVAGTTPGTYVCADAPTTKTMEPTVTFPIACEPGHDQCVSTDGKYTQTCLCGVNNSGQGYCPLFAGDPPFLNFKSAFQTFLDYNGSCNTYSRFSLSCLKSKSPTNLGSWYNFKIGYLLAYQNMWPQFYNPDSQPCVDQTVAAEYVELVTEKEKVGEVQCPRYICDESQDVWTDGQCAFFDQNAFDYGYEKIVRLRNCTSTVETECPVVRSSNSTCTAAVEGHRLPGDYCDSVWPCIAPYTCDTVTQRCVGGGVAAATCTSLWDCQAGLFCNTTSLQCQTQKADGQPCSADYNCGVQSTCDNGVCVTLFSKPVGAKTSIGENPNGLSMACQYGFAVSGADGGFVCAKPTITQRTTLINCNPGGVCRSTSGQQEKPCTCGFNNEGISYCPYFEGDLPLQKAIAYFNKVLANSRSKPTSCNTYSRLQPGCYQTYHDGLDQNFYLFITNFYRYRYGALMANNTSCIRGTFTKDYFIDLSKYKRHQKPNPHDEDDDNDDHDEHPKPHPRPAKNDSDDDFDYDEYVYEAAANL